MHLLRQRHLFALATYGLPPPCPSKPPRIPLPGPPAPTLSGSISGTLSGSLSGSRPRCGPSHSFNISAPHPGTFLHTSHARNSSNSGLCFQQLAHSFIFRILQVLCLPLLREPPGCIPTIPNLERISRRLQPHSSSFFSHSSTLFCARQKLNSFLFMHFRTLRGKHRGWG